MSNSSDSPTRCCPGGQCGNAARGPTPTMVGKLVQRPPARRPYVRIQTGTFLRNLLGETAIADKESIPATDKQIAALTAEVGQIADIDWIADDKKVEAFVGDGKGEAVAAVDELIHDNNFELMVLCQVIQSCMRFRNSFQANSNCTSRQPEKPKHGCPSTRLC